MLGKYLHELQQPRKGVCGAASEAAANVLTKLNVPGSFLFTLCKDLLELKSP